MKPSASGAFSARPDCVRVDGGAVICAVRNGAKPEAPKRSEQLPDSDVACR